jgi:hypothetical protein
LSSPQGVALPYTLPLLLLKLLDFLLIIALFLLSLGGLLGFVVKPRRPSKLSSSTRRGPHEIIPLGLTRRGQNRSLRFNVPQRWYTIPAGTSTASRCDTPEVST